MASRNAPKSRSHANLNPMPSPRTCLCSPTAHPGSFRCSMHKKSGKAMARPVAQIPSKSNHPHRRRDSSMAAEANALKLKAVLLQIIKPSGHDLHRRKNFQAKPTRFCLMNRNRDAVAVAVA